MSIRNALQFQETTRIPRDLGATTVSAISRSAYERAMKARDLSADTEAPEAFDVIQQIVQPSDEVRKHLGVDTRRLGIPRLIGEQVVLPRETASGVYECVDQFGCIWSFDPNHDHYFNMITAPLQDYEDAAEALESYTFPSLEPDRPAIEAFLDCAAAKLFDGESDKGRERPLIVADRNIAGLTEVAFRIRGYENFFVDLIADPDTAGELLDSILDYKLAYWTMLHEYLAAKDLLSSVDVVVECDDLGTQDSLLCSPQTMKQVVFPRQARLFSELRRLFPHSKRFFHSDGAIRPIIPDLIEAGVDILNPVQFTAREMELSALKKDFGSDLVFWGGGIDTQEVLPFGTPEQVRDETKRCIDTLAPGGGFVFATVHNIQADVPPENFWAMWETVQSYD